MDNSVLQYDGLPVFEDKKLTEGTFVFLDKDGLPIKSSDAGKIPPSSLVVQNFETFMIAMNHNKKP